MLKLPKGKSGNKNNNKNHIYEKKKKKKKKMRGVRNEINYSEPCSNAPDKAQLSLGCSHLSTSERIERVFKWAHSKLNCVLSGAFEHGSE